MSLPSRLRVRSARVEDLQMAGDPRRPRPVWRPPGADDPASKPRVERPATQILRVADLRASAERPPVPEPEPEPIEPGTVDLGGATTGRGLASAPEPPPAPTPEPTAPRGSPFQPFAARPDGLAQAPRSDNLPVIAIVGGLVAIVLAAVALVAMALVMASRGEPGGEPGTGALAGDGAVHLGDTDVGEVAEPRAPVRRPGGAAAVAPTPQRLDGTIVLGENKPFRSVEVSCTRSGLRKRATFRDGRATVQDLPVDEDCSVKFLGAEPAQTTLRGGQTRRCVFGPTRCETL